MNSARSTGKRGKYCSLSLQDKLKVIEKLERIALAKSVVAKSGSRKTTFCDKNLTKD